MNNDSDKLVGKVLGGFELLEFIGAGGMCAVYRSHQPDLDRKVAVKVLFTHLVSQPEFFERFKREAKIIATLNHPQIVEIYAYGIDQKTNLPYIAMQYLEGGTLADKLTEYEKNNQLQSLDAIALLLNQLAEPLEYAHASGVIHRDIKPGNIMFDKKGIPTLVDFGVARMTGVTQLTMAGTILGTPDYMSPEQWRGEKLSAKTDQYALAVVVYQMVSRQLPFKAKLVQDLREKHLIEPPPSLHQINSHIPQSVTSVVEQALEKDQNKRFPSITAFIKAFETAIQGKISEQQNESIRLEPPLQPEIPAQNQTILQIGIPRQSENKSNTNLLIKIAKPESEGLNSEIPNSLIASEIIQKNITDHSISSTVRFPQDKVTKQLSQTTLQLTVISEYFDVQIIDEDDTTQQSNQVKLEVLPDQDSETLEFTLSPRHDQFLGTAGVDVSVMQGKQLIVKTTLSTQVVEERKDKGWNIVDKLLKVVPDTAVMKQQMEFSRYIRLPIVLAIIAGLFSAFNSLVDNGFRPFDPLPIIPSKTATPTTPVGGANFDIEIRESPDFRSRIVGTLAKGNKLDVLSRDSDSNWYLVILPNGSEGWIRNSQALVTIYGDATSIPTITNTPMPATIMPHTLIPTTLVPNTPTLTYTPIPTTLVPNTPTLTYTPIPNTLVPNTPTFTHTPTYTHSPIPTTKISDLITNQQYRNCRNSEQCISLPADASTYYSADNVNKSVIGVSWDGANEYCIFKGGNLPTREEWLKALDSNILQPDQSYLEWIHTSDIDLQNIEPTHEIPAITSSGELILIQANDTASYELIFRCMLP